MLEVLLLNVTYSKAKANITNSYVSQLLHSFNGDMSEIDIPDSIKCLKKALLENLESIHASNLENCRNGKEYFSVYTLPNIEIADFLRYKVIPSDYKGAIIGITTSKGICIGICKRFVYDVNSNSVICYLVDKNNREIKLPIGTEYPTVYANFKGSDNKKDIEIVDRNIKLCIDELKGQIVLSENNNNDNDENGHDILKIYNSLNDSQLRKLETVFKEQIKKYSIRTQNRILSISLNTFVTDYLCFPNERLLNIRNFGKKSLVEGIDLKRKLKTEIRKFSSFIQEDLEQKGIQEDYIMKYSVDYTDEFIVNFYQKNGHLPMFWILEQQLTKNQNRSIEILKDSFPIFNNYRFQTLDKIATKYSLTRERVRQIRHNTFRKTFEITNELVEYKKNDDLFKYAELLSNKDDWKYLLELLQETEAINQESFEIQELLKKEQCRFSKLFVLQIAAYIYRDKFSLLGKFCVSDKSKNNIFLIRKELTDVFDFGKFIDEFANHIDENETEYDLNVEDFLSNSGCWTSVIDLDKFNDVVKIVKDILLYEFHLYSNLDGLITISATKGRRPLDIVYEILKKNENPMHLGDIFVEFKKILPEHKYTEAAQLRPWLQRHEAISYRNRKSVYTLKEWDHIKSGTIRDAIIEFLMKKDSPQTADDITEYVLQYFPKTNTASVRTTMFNDTQKRFLYFNDGLFGLVSKTYPDNYEEIKQQEGQRKAFEQRLYDLEKFLSENDHFPFATSDNEEESSLYRWWKIQNRDAKLSEQQKAEIDRIKSQYADFDTEKTVYEWFFHFNDFKLFVLENRRLPSSSGSEKILYGWFRRTKDDFLNERLSEKQRTKYAELFKEINYAEG